MDSKPFVDRLINPKITSASLITLIKVGFLGFLCAESWYLSRAIFEKLINHISAWGHECEVITFCLIGFLLIIFYLLERGFLLESFKVIKSKRFDVLIIFCIGILFSIAFEGFVKNKYVAILSNLTIQQLSTLLIIPIALGFLLLAKAIYLELRGEKKKEPFFLTDVEKTSQSEDLLNFTDQAERFASKVFNQGSSDSLVFGIDAPWGIGKSTFVNLCKESWANEKYNNQIVVYSFNPLRYEDRTNLLEKFIDGLINVIQKDSFIPEIRPIVSKYSRFIKATKGSFSFFGMNFEIFPAKYTIDDAFEDLETTLEGFSKKIIIVVDDLDRLSFSAIKDVLFVIKKSFTLPNISYVLCYDTENIGVLEDRKPDVEKVTEFLEKFVSVKIGLYLDHETLIDYVSTNLNKALSGNSQVDPLLVSKAVRGLSDIYKSSDYHLYPSLVGDVRKLKRLINTLLMFELEKTDFENTDFDTQDLIHLLLIYINYPTVFRKIYNTETGGKRGFFSLVSPYDDDYPKSNPPRTRESEYKNSGSYSKYIETLTENQKFLVNKVFNVSQRLEDRDIDSVDQEIKTSYACFNGGWNHGGNLEQYLNLLVKFSKPQKSDQHRFYVNLKNKVLAGVPMDEILSAEEFSYSKNENSHEQLWRVLVNSLSDFTPEAGAKLITYLVNNITNYSLLKNDTIGIGFRDNLDMYLIKTLDQVGWHDEDNKHINNTEENISEIAEWIFGENRHSGNGIIQSLSAEDRGIIGFYDLIAFRLFCSADRGGGMFNLERALSKHGDRNAPTDGATDNIAIEEMREISQKVFQIFKEKYIDTNKNIFDLVDELSLRELTGKYQEFVQGKIDSGEVESIDNDMAKRKSTIKSFIVYQLSNSLVSHGVGCGYYDPIGKEDQKGIRSKMNDYLFDQCFNPEINERNYKHFLNYLLMNFADIFRLRSDHRYTPNINEFTKALDQERLLAYWGANREKIKALNLTDQDVEVITPNYTAYYKDDLPPVYELLDGLLPPSNEIS